MSHTNLARIAGLILLLIALPVMSDDAPIFKQDDDPLHTQATEPQQAPQPANPLLQAGTFPDFSTITADHFAPAMDAVLQQFNTRLSAVLQAQPSWDNTIQPMEEETTNVTRVWNIISHLNKVNNTEKIRAAYTALLPKVTGFYAAMRHNTDLYNAYASIQASPEFAKLTNEQQVVTNNMLLDFKLSGTHLTGQQKERYKQIVIRLDELGNKFSSNVLDATQAWQYEIPLKNAAQLDGVPDYVKDAAAKKAKSLGKSGWVLTLDEPCLIGISTYAKDRALRQTIFTAFSTLASDQDPDPNRRKWDNALIIQEILNLRKELALLLGFKNYAEFSLADKEAPDTNKVMSFLGDLATQAQPVAQKEVAILEQYAQLNDKLDHLQAWDVSYYSEMYRQNYYGISQQEIRNYFPEDTVLDGLFDTLNLIFNIRINEIKDPNVWNKTVKLYEITDQDKNIRGYFYLDLYTRDLKRSGAWVGDYLSRLRFSDGKIQYPVAFVQTNFMPSPEKLLTHQNVVTLFHEIGHMLQHTLSLCNYPSISGLDGVAWDTVELASQFMENWAWQLPVINDISKHYSTGADLPEALFNRLLAARNFNAGITMLRQVEYALFDFRLYLNQHNDSNKTPMEILNDIRLQTSAIPTLDCDRLPNRFRHVFAGGYAAGYYGYKWSEVLACDAFSAFQETGLFNPQIGRKFMNTFLEQGGEKSTLDLFIEFRGRAPTIKPLLTQYGIG